MSAFLSARGFTYAYYLSSLDTLPLWIVRRTVCNNLMLVLTVARTTVTALKVLLVTNNKTSLYGYSVYCVLAQVRLVS